VELIQAGDLPIPSSYLGILGQNFNKDSQLPWNILAIALIILGQVANDHIEVICSWLVIFMITITTNTT